MRKHALIALLATTLPGAAVATSLQQNTAVRAAAESAAIEQFARQIANDVEQDDVGAITAAVFVGGEIVWAKGFSWADRNRRFAADANTIYRIGSISKSFTALLMAQLAARDMLDIDKRLSDYLPEAKRLAGGADTLAGVTPRRLASHTAGLIREPELPRAAAGPIAMWEDKVIGFGMLGLAVSRAAGRPFMDLVTEYIIEPLEMKQTVFVMTPELYPHLAVGYSVSRDATISPDMPALEHWDAGTRCPTVGSTPRLATWPGLPARSRAHRRWKFCQRNGGAR